MGGREGTDRHHPGQPEITRPYNERPIVHQLPARSSNKQLLTPGMAPVRSWYTKDGPDPLDTCLSLKDDGTQRDTAKDICNVRR